MNDRVRFDGKFVKEVVGDAVKQAEDKAVRDRAEQQRLEAERTAAHKASVDALEARQQALKKQRLILVAVILIAGLVYWRYSSSTPPVSQQPVSTQQSSTNWERYKPPGWLTPDHPPDWRIITVDYTNKEVSTDIFQKAKRWNDELTQGISDWKEYADIKKYPSYQCLKPDQSFEQYKGLTVSESLKAVIQDSVIILFSSERKIVLSHQVNGAGQLIEGCWRASANFRFSPSKLMLEVYDGSILAEPFIKP